MNSVREYEVDFLDVGATRLARRIEDALSQLAEHEAAAKYAAMSRRDCSLKVNHATGQATFFVAGEPFFSCPTAYLYGDAGVAGAPAFA